LRYPGVYRGWSNFYIGAFKYLATLLLLRGVVVDKAAGDQRIY